MKTIRIIPRLDIKGPNLVKGIHLEGLRVLGKPSEFAKFYYEEGADELFYQDTVASLYGRNSLNEFISEAAKDIFIPLTVGGGLRKIEDIRNVLRFGADKVSINTGAVSRPSFINEASKIFGSSTIVIAIEVIKSEDGKYQVFTDNGREYTGFDAIEWAKEVQDRGAGEIYLTSIDNEGTGEGYNMELIEKVSNNLEIPLIVHGGASTPKDIYEVIKNGNADAVSMSSMIHYTIIKKQLTDKKFDSDEGNKTFLNTQQVYKDFGKYKISDIKDYLEVNSIEVRKTW